MEGPEEIKALEINGIMKNDKMIKSPNGHID